MRSHGNRRPKRKKQSKPKGTRRQPAVSLATKSAKRKSGGEERTVAVRAPVRKSTKRRDEGEERLARRWVEEAVLAERLGLNDDWIDRWEENGQVKEESLAPFELPPFIRATFEYWETGGQKVTSKYEREEVERNVAERMNAVNDAIKRLVAAGCRKQVIYFCLEELSPRAEMRRFQGKPDEGSESPEAVSLSPKDADLPTPAMPMPPRKLAQRASFKELPVAARRTRRLLRTFRNELWHVAHAAERLRSVRRQLRLARATRDGQNPPAAEPDGGMNIDLPQGTLTNIDTPEEALSLLDGLLPWVARLAKAYTAPFEERVLQSKGFIFLTDYVSRHADLGGSQYDAHGGKDDPLSVLANLVGGKQWPPSYLKDKLRKFVADHPDLYFLLHDKLDELHEFHAAHQ